LNFSRTPEPDSLRPPELHLPSVQFRLATRADLRSLHRACFSAEPFDDFAARFASSVHQQEKGRLLHVIAVQGPRQRPVASGQLISYTDTIAEIADLNVAERVRGQGVGTALVRILGALAAAAGAERLELAVRVDNSRALALYRRLGFRACRLLRFPSGHRAILLARAPWPLPAPGQKEATDAQR
jgi:ribosomal protein S18 acetylase RimI-like enzyme